MSTNGQLSNYMKGEWRRSSASEYLEITNPATAEKKVVIERWPKEWSRKF